MVNDPRPPQEPRDLPQSGDQSDNRPTDQPTDQPQEQPAGPRDQQGFENLRPRPEHPMAEWMRREDEEKARYEAARRKEEEERARRAERRAARAAEEAEDSLEGREDDPTDPAAAGGDGSGGDGGGHDDGGHDDGDHDGGGHDGGGSPDEDEHPPMGLLDHLDDLRRTLIESGLAAIVASVVSWFFSKRLLEILILPIKEEGIYFSAPNEAFLTQLKLSLAMGLFVVAPFIFFKFYMFVLPGLHRREAKVVTPLLISSTLLFYTGVAFSFLVVIPQVMSFLLSFGTDSLRPIIGVSNYFNFVTHLCLAFGLVFQLPLLILALSSIGIVNPRMLLRGWRMAIVVIFAASAILTPPDVISQIMMAGPVILLYLGSVLVAMVVTRNKRKED